MTAGEPDLDPGVQRDNGATRLKRLLSLAADLESDGLTKADDIELAPLLDQLEGFLSQRQTPQKQPQPLPSWPSRRQWQHRELFKALQTNDDDDDVDEGYYQDAVPKDASDSQVDDTMELSTTLDALALGDISDESEATERTPTNNRHQPVVTGSPAVQTTRPINLTSFSPPSGWAPTTTARLSSRTVEEAESVVELHSSGCLLDEDDDETDAVIGWRRPRRIYARRVVASDDDDDEGEQKEAEDSCCESVKAESSTKKEQSPPKTRSSPPRPVRTTRNATAGAKPAAEYTPVIVISDSEDEASLSIPAATKRTPPSAHAAEEDDALLIFTGATHRTRKITAPEQDKVPEPVTPALQKPRELHSTDSFRFFSDEDFNTPPVNKYTPLIERVKSRSLLPPAKPCLGSDDDEPVERQALVSTPTVAPATTPSSTVKLSARDARALRAAKAAKAQFRKTREQRTRELFNEFNANIFSNQLPDDFPIKWSERLASTAGRTFTLRQTFPSGEVRYTSSIELSGKVLDDDERLQKTLAHEMCHVAAWLIDHTNKPPHGLAFKAWADIVAEAYPELAVTTCHSYEIDFKHKWECTNAACRNIIGRHAKTIDITKVGCGKCGSILRYLEKLKADGTPMKARQPSAWQTFVKTKYPEIKEATPGATHKDVMAQLTQRWKAIKPFAEREDSSQSQ
ncbi:hypothetical protein RI367_002030 [Sorochytrium milnesiophthora]